jgi:hypothetical protein
VSNEKGGRTSPALAQAVEAMPARRFPPPWSVDETDACFIVRDHAGQALAYVYFEDEPGRPAAPNLLTPDDARNAGLASCSQRIEIVPADPDCFGADR